MRLPVLLLVLTCFAPGAEVVAQTGPLPRATAGAATEGRVRIEITNNVDVTQFNGTEFYIGYGTSDAEMLQAQRYRGVFKITMP